MAANRVKSQNTIAEPIVAKQPSKEPNKMIAIDIADTKKIMRNIIVQTTTLSVGDVVAMPTVINPILATNACYKPKDQSIIELGTKTKSRDQVVFQ
jgi:hypothetical protein